jgi:hypothetical protein
MLKGTVMSKVKNVIFDIQDEIRSGELTFGQIVKKYDVTMMFVVLIYEEMCETEFADE